MALQINRDDLMYEYTWTTDENDDPKITGHSDSDLIDRDEGYEILPFINSLLNEWDLKKMNSANKIEYMIHILLPGDVRSRSRIKKWISDNWKKTEYP